MYFSYCHTAEECRSVYKELAKKLHPDKGGKASDFQQMQEEYEKRLAELISETTQNTVEYERLVTALIELIKATKPEYYTLIKMISNHSSVSLINELVSIILPKHKNSVNKIITMLQ